MTGQRKLLLATALIAGLGVAGLGASLPAAAQTVNMVKPKAYRWTEIPADWNGVWLPNSDPALTNDGPPPLKPEIAKRVAEIRAAARAGRPIVEGAECAVPGMPGLVTLTLFPLEIQVNPVQTTVMAEYHSQIMRIYTDGRGHPEEPNLSSSGHTTGEWRNKELFAETVALKPNDQRSEAMVIKQHWRLADKDTLKLELTVTDPNVYTRPYVIRRTYQRRPEWEAVEFDCQENNRNPTLADGTVGVILPGEETTR